MNLFDEFLSAQAIKSNNRYRTTIIKVNDLSFTSHLYAFLKDKFPNYSCWEGLDLSSTLSHLSANNLIRVIRAEKVDGIIFYFPEEWQVFWNIRAKQSFMSALSMLAGDVPHMILICKDSEQFSSINNQYFKLFKVMNHNCEILVPQKAEINIKAM